MNLFSEVEPIFDLFDKSWRFRNSREFIAFFKFIAKFKHYSRYNTMLVYIQNPEVEFFGGVGYWRDKFGRGVKADAKKHIILSPGGPVMLVFDIKDTVGKLSYEDFMAQGLGYDHSEVRGKIYDFEFNTVIEEIKNYGIRLTYRPLSYFNTGYVTTIFNSTLEICLKEGMTREQNFSVLIHELAHLFLGHTQRKHIQHIDKKNPTKLPIRPMIPSTEELEAETVSYLICHKLGLEPRSAEYLASYITSVDDFKDFDYSMVVKTADKLEGLFLPNTPF